MIGFVHPALLYASDEDYLAGLVPFVTDGLDRDPPVAVAVPAPRLRLLRPAVPAADRVLWIDMGDAGRNPGRIIPAVLHRFADRHPARHVRIVGEPIWPGRSDTEYPACAQHEALINHAFAGRDLTIVCPYDTAGLGPEVIEDARATHPEVWEKQRRGASLDYAPDDVVSRYNRPLPVPADAVELTVASAQRLREARQWASEHAKRLGLTAATRLADLELVVTELATNSIEHAHTEVRVRLWRVEGHLLCEVHDTGRLTDPLAGRRPPREGQFRGRGLLLVNQLADLVRTVRTPEGTTHYAFLRLEA